MGSLDGGKATMNVKLSRSRVCVLATLLLAVTFIASYAVLASAQTADSTAPAATGTSDLGTLLGVSDTSSAPQEAKLGAPTTATVPTTTSSTGSGTSYHSRRPPVSWFYPF